MTNFLQQIVSLLFFLTLYLSQVLAEVCEHGLSCSSHQRCCPSGCCYRHHDDDDHDDDDDDNDRYTYGYRLSIWNMWYFWFVVLFVLMSCFGGCGYYKQRQRVLRTQHNPPRGFLSVFDVTARRRPSGTRIVTVGTTVYPPQPGYRTQSGYGYAAEPEIVQAPGSNLSPPPYSEVMSHPDLFPCNTKSGIPAAANNPPGIPPGYRNVVNDAAFGSNHYETDASGQIPQPPPYSEIANQNPEASVLPTNRLQQESNQASQ